VCDNVINDVIDGHLSHVHYSAAHTLPPPTADPPYSPDGASVQPDGSVAAWLAGLKMERYGENFAHCGYSRVGQLTRLSRGELDQMGVTLVGHQRRILRGVRALVRAAADHDNITPRSDDPLLQFATQALDL